MTQKLKIVILISGTGSNMLAIADAAKEGTLNCDIKMVISNNAAAPGIESAKSLGLATLILDHKKYQKREEFEQELIKHIDKVKPDLICLAGFMRVLTSTFINHYKDKIINIHPSLLPSFKGVDAVKQAYEYGVKIVGCTVHFVSEEIDSGKIILQRSIDVKNNESYEELKDRLLKIEHGAYIEAINILANKAY